MAAGSFHDGFYGPNQNAFYGVGEDAGLALDVLPPGTPSDEQFGNATLRITVAPVGIPSEEAVGSPRPTLAIRPTGVASGEIVSSPQAGFVVRPTGIASGEAFGTATSRLTVLPGGVASDEAFGSARPTLIIGPTGTVSGEAFGQLSANPTVQPGGISTGEAVGGASLHFSVHSEGAVSQEEFGAATVQFSVDVPGIPSEEGVGSPRFDLSVYVSDIASAEDFGSPRSQGTLHMQPTPTGEGVGEPTVLGGVVTQVVRPGGIGSAEAVQSPLTRLHLRPSSVDPTETVGIPALYVWVRPSSIAPGEAFGPVRISIPVSPSTILSVEGVSDPTVVLGTPGLTFATPNSITSSEAFGTAAVVPGALTVHPTSIPTSEEFGDPTLQRPFRLVLPTGIQSEELFGAHETREPIDWWSSEHLYRRRLEVIAPPDHMVPVGHPVTVNLPLAGTRDQGKTRHDYADVEVVRLVDGRWRRLGRQVLEAGEDLAVTFQIDDPITATQSTNYYLFYGSPSASDAGRPNFEDNPWPVSVEHDDPLVAYTRPLEHWEEGRTVVRDARATLEFTGTRIRWLARTSVVGGIAEIQVDEEPWTEMDLFSPVNEATVAVYTREVLSPGLHKIRVRASGRSNPISAGIEVNVVRFEYAVPVTVVDFGEEVDRQTWALMLVGA